MPAQPRPDDADVGATMEPPAVTACRASPGRFVFIEERNADGWIATDDAVAVRR
ncbi:MAG: hypothetical protein ACLFM8_07245 [Halobacteriales archaeon]